MAHVLIIDDEPELLREKVCQVFPAPEHRVESACTGTDGIDRVSDTPPDVVLLDLRLPDQTGLDVLTSLRKIDARIPVLFVTSARSADAAIEAMRQGAYDYLLKPLDLQTLDRVVHEALNVARLMREPAVVAQTLADDDVVGDAFIGCCPAMQEVYKAIGRVADQAFPVLITGESGTGKELVARAVYQHSSRSKAPFLALNCAAIPEQLLESELFGHEKGAFTGADRRRVGKFEQCDRGTLFLDEIGDMPLATQAKVLRILQDQEFVRLGGEETIRTDVRLLAATHRDLKQWSDEGKFRADLYHRISVGTINLPSLRERGDDLAMLVRHQLRRFSREMGREAVDVSLAAMDRLRGYSWPGNVRELQNVLRQALLKTRGQVLLPEFLPQLDANADAAISGNGSATAAAESGLESFIRRELAAQSSDLLEQTHRWVERILVPMVLQHTHGNRKQAAQILGIARQTLRAKLREMGATIQSSVDVVDDDES
jgi:two-component system nitrogen regulation response regulator GlnG